MNIKEVVDFITKSKLGRFGIFVIKLLVVLKGLSIATNWIVKKLHLKIVIPLMVFMFFGEYIFNWITRLWFSKYFDARSGVLAFVSLIIWYLIGRANSTKEPGVTMVFIFLGHLGLLTVYGLLYTL